MIQVFLILLLNLNMAWSKDPAISTLVCSSIFSTPVVVLQSWEHYHILTKDHRMISNARYLGPSSQSVSKYDFLDIDGTVHTVPYDQIQKAQPTGPGIPSKSWYKRYLQSDSYLQSSLKIFLDKPWFQNVRSTEFEEHILHASHEVPKDALIQFQKDLQTSLDIFRQHNMVLPKIQFHLGYSTNQTIPQVYAYNADSFTSKKVERTYNIFWKIVWPLRHIQHHLSTLFHEVFHLWISGQPITPVLNEALADFMAAHFLNSPQISPGYWKDQRPVRDISTLQAFHQNSAEKFSKEIPTENLDYIPYHLPSLLISHVLWEARSTLNPIDQEKMFQFIYQKIFHHYSDYKSLRTEYRKAAADSEFYYDLELISALLIQFSEQSLAAEAQNSFLEKLKSLINDYHFDFQILRQFGRTLNQSPQLHTDIH